MNLDCFLPLLPFSNNQDFLVIKIFEIRSILHRAMGFFFPLNFRKHTRKRELMYLHWRYSCWRGWRRLRYRSKWTAAACGESGPCTVRTSSWVSRIRRRRTCGRRVGTAPRPCGPSRPRTPLSAIVISFSTVLFGRAFYPKMPAHHSGGQLFH